MRMSTTLISGRAVGETFLQSWDGFLPPGSIVMGRKSEATDPSGVDEEVLKKEQAAPAHEIPFFFFAKFAPGSETETLFLKITQALGLSAGSFAVGEKVPTGTIPRVCVRFGAEGLRVGEWMETQVEGHRVPLIATHALESLARDAGLKKETWNHLKIAAEHLGLRIPQK